jgi:hypothetical protein
MLVIVKIKNKQYNIKEGDQTQSQGIDLVPNPQNYSNSTSSQNSSFSSSASYNNSFNQQRVVPGLSRF